MQPTNLAVAGKPHAATEHLEIFEQPPRDNAAAGKRPDELLGEVRLVANNNDIVYVPAPTQDPRDPLNLSWNKKMIALAIYSSFTMFGGTITNVAGSLIPYFEEAYKAEGVTDVQLSRLSTVPTISMGIVNFVSIPIALAVGRRPVFLVSSLMLIIGLVVCATSPNYNAHFAGRIILGLAAGQSEALCPLMVKESFFIHERSRRLTWQSSFQNIGGAVLTFTAPFMVGKLGWRNFYWFYAGFAVITGICAIFWAPETRYSRTLLEHEGIRETPYNWEGAEPTSSSVSDVEKDSSLQTYSTSVTVKPPLDFKRYQARTWRSDICFTVGEANWSEAMFVWKSMVEIIWIPSIAWVVLINCFSLAGFVCYAVTYASVLTAAPYNWANSIVGLPALGQIVVAFICFPMLGSFSDWVVRFKAQRNGGVHQPEYRLYALVFPYVLGVGTTYLLDTHTRRSGAVLALICGCRGLVVYGLSFSILPEFTTLGFMNTFLVYVGIMGFLGLCGIGIYFGGHKLRAWESKFALTQRDVNRESADH
ncbi:MFS general substrate transporter [Meredithblackwellia eburnea MCA 4105]